MEEELNHRISSLLSYGMTASVLVILLGLLLLIFLPGDYAEVTMSLGEIARDLLEVNPIAVIDLGIIMLIATPLVRVLALAISFALAKESKFVLACVIVLLLVVVTVLLKAGA
ncbi:DUF1634 domain-containing protein [Candidatus Methanomassiliicoccus intestinalis]|uniref:DUF1634 domain-containing protein n=1 Tax=Candidatus Methanomassiliicoccus intestinalis TaxID=1406512 RepID=UPI0037DC4FF1